MSNNNEKFIFSSTSCLGSRYSRNVDGCVRKKNFSNVSIRQWSMSGTAFIVVSEKYYMYVMMVLNLLSVPFDRRTGDVICWIKITVRYAVNLRTFSRHIKQHYRLLDGLANSVGADNTTCSGLWRNKSSVDHSYQFSSFYTTGDWCLKLKVLLVHILSGIHVLKTSKIG